MEEEEGQTWTKKKKRQTIWGNFDFGISANFDFGQTGVEFSEVELVKVSSIFDLSAYPERVSLLAVWMSFKNYSFQDERNLEAQLIRRRNGRQIVEVVGAEGVDDEVPNVWVAIQSKTGFWQEPKWVSCSPMMLPDSRPFVVIANWIGGVIIQRMTLEEKAEIVMTLQLDFRVLGDKRDQGGCDFCSVCSSFGVDTM